MIIKCKICGGDIAVNEDKTFGTCEYCGSTMTLPKVSDEQRAALFNRGNHFRRQGEFDKALSVYENIVRDNDADAEAHWCCALCRFGIEYVEDPNTFEYVPTCHRASFDSFLEDVDYLAALENSDGITKRQYQKDAAKIAEVQKGILATSQNEEPFDVFICYKETDDNTKERTKDSIDAQEIYYQLTNEGYRVFFSRITLEDKVGAEYEPYIFAALNSAKVMVAVGSKPEYFNAVWVKNEWSRFLALMRKDRSKLLLPCYKGMDPYDLPEQLSVLQSYDMGKIGFIQDLIRGVKKVLRRDEPAPTVVQQTVVQQTAAPAGNAAPLLRRAFMFLEDGDWAKADDFAEQVLNIEPENAEAYLAKLMSELKVRKRENLPDCPQPFDGSNNFNKAVRFGDEKLKNELNGCVSHIKERNELNRKTSLYDSAMEKMSAADTEEKFKAASEAFKLIPGFKDADKLVKDCLEKAELTRKTSLYDSALGKMNKARYEAQFRDAYAAFGLVPGFMDADKLAEECFKKAEAEAAEMHRKAKLVEAALRAGEMLKKAPPLEEALEAGKTRIAYLSGLLGIGDTVFSRISYAEAELSLIDSQTAQLSSRRAALDLFAVKEKKKIDGALAALGAKRQETVSMLSDLKKTTGGYRTKGEIVRDLAAAREQTDDYKRKIESKRCGEEQTYSFEKAVRIYMSDRRIAEIVKTSFPGAVFVCSRFAFGKTSAGNCHTVGLRADGTVVAVGRKEYGPCFVSGWKDIVAVSAGYQHTVGLREDGTVVAVGSNRDGQCGVSGWKDIVAVSAGWDHTVGLRTDGTVAAVGDKHYRRCDVSGWRDIVAVSAGGYHTVGLMANGTAVAVGYNGDGQCDVSGWRDIVAISAGYRHTVGLRADGTVVATKYTGDHNNYYGQCGVSGWKDIVAVCAGYRHTVGLRADGTVVAVGYNDDGQCGVSGWTDIVAVNAGWGHTVGLRTDGTVVAVGYNKYGQCDVSGWSGICIPTRSEK